MRAKGLCAICGWILFEGKGSDELMTAVDKHSQQPGHQISYLKETGGDDPQEIKL